MSGICPTGFPAFLIDTNKYWKYCPGITFVPCGPSFCPGELDAAIIDREITNSKNISETLIKLIIERDNTILRLIVQAKFSAYIMLLDKLMILK